MSIGRARWRCCDPILMGLVYKWCRALHSKLSTFPLTVIYNRSQRKIGKIRKSLAKALFPFQYVSFTFSIRFHPLTRFIFVYVIRKRRRKNCTQNSLSFPSLLIIQIAIYSIFPYFFFSFLFYDLSSSTVSQNTFRTPVYTTSMRRSAMGVGLVFEADLGTTEHVNRWVLQGVCLTLNDD